MIVGMPAFADDHTDTLSEAVALCLSDEVSSTEALQQDLRAGGWSDAEDAQALLMAEGIAIRNHLFSLRPEPPTSAEVDRAIGALQNWVIDGAPALESPEGFVVHAHEEDVEDGRRRQCQIVGAPNSVTPDVLTFYDGLVEMFDPGYESYSAPHYRFRDEGRVVVVILVRPDPVDFNAANPDRPGAEWLVLLHSVVVCEACG